MRPAGILALIALSFGGAREVASQEWDTAAPPSPWERAYIGSRIYSAINIFFAHWQALPNYDLPTQYQSYLREAFAARDRRTFDLATSAFLATLHNGHTGFGDRHIRMGFARSIGFLPERIDGEWIVTLSDLSAVHPGDVLTAIDGEPVDAFVARNRRYLPSSSERSALRELFLQPYLFPERFTLSVEGGKRVSVDQASAVAPPEQVSYRMMAAGAVGYLRVPGFDEQRLEDSAVAFVRANRQLRAIIVDVRRNHGGSTPTSLIASLMDRGYRWFSESTPLTIGLFDFYRQQASGNTSAYYAPFADFFTHARLSWTQPPESPDSAAYSGRVVILADQGCFSACEDFIEPFKDNGRATIVGDTTGGSTGQPYFESFPNGMGFAVSTKREEMPNGAAFEGAGIAPDILVVPTAQDLRRGIDTVLERALSIAVQH